MIAIDTNLLIDAHRSTTPEHRVAKAAIERALNATGGCGIALPIIAEFFSIVTRRTTSGRPSTPASARGFVTSLLGNGLPADAPVVSLGRSGPGVRSGLLETPHARFVGVFLASAQAASPFARWRHVCVAAAAAARRVGGRARARRHSSATARSTALPQRCFG